MATAKRSRQPAAKRSSKKNSKKRATTAAVARSTPKTPAPAQAVEAPEASPQQPPATTSGRLPSAWSIGRKAVVTLREHWLLFGGILAVYMVMSLILVQGFGSGIDLASLKNSMGGNAHGGFSSLLTGLTVFAVLFTSAGAHQSSMAGTYQAITTLVASLAIVWALRQVTAGANNIRIRDSFYRGMYPVIPVFLVILVIMLQLLPFILTGYLYGLVSSTGIAVHLIEQILWLLLFFAGLAVTVYFLSSSLLALYICALPDMTPLTALRSAKKLVTGRRWSVIRKLLALPLGLFIAGAIIMVPVILLLTSAALLLLYVLSLMILLVVHAYMYTLYRELLV